jgi:hypothetical protein
MLVSIYLQAENFAGSLLQKFLKLLMWHPQIMLAFLLVAIFLGVLYAK